MLFDYVRDHIPSSFGDKSIDTTLGKKLWVISQLFALREKQIEKSFEEIFAQTTDELVKRWEKMLALYSNESDPVELRRARVMAKLLQREFMTRERMENIINQFVPARTACIIESFETYTFEVIIPADDVRLMQPILDAIEEYKPAHLGYMLTAKSSPEVIILNGSAQYHEVDYYICDTIYPEDDAEGRLYSETIDLGERGRNHTVDFLITDTFYPEEETI